jgi:hypothetical protein
MRWVRDRTGRLPQRPYYERAELDQECEGIVAAFLRAKHGAVAYPIQTDDLVRLLQRATADLDLYADFGDPDVEGVTGFVPGERPRVRIARVLTEQTWRENRLRTTLAHEFGHVTFHDLWSADQPALPLFDRPAPVPCARDQILGAGADDWREWQAGYASGAFLMPQGAVRPIVAATVEAFGVYAPVPTDSPAGQALVERLQRAFQVSADAARVRLRQLAVLGTAPASSPLF